jgi:precorrin-3B C17-methyltransferase
MTLRAREELQNAEVIVGYTTYVDLVRGEYPQAEFVTTPMRKEAERCRIALERASAGQRVAVVCSGDPGVYGMAGLLHELAPAYPGVSVEVVPGVTAATGGAALLGAPLMTDWCCVSLSDLMTPWHKIEARLRAASRADFCICLYNPGSRGRADHLRRACDVLLEYASPSTVCGVVRNIGRTDESSRILTLAELRNTHVDMLTCVFIGNSQTRAIDGHMVTPRGYDVRRGEVDQKGVSPSVQGVAPSVYGHTRPHVLVFGGTTEGRELVEWLDARGTCHVVACVATEYGAELLREGARVEVVRGPLSPDDKRRLVSEHDFLCVVDATHPYAQHISASVDELARRTGLDVVRVQRDSVEMAYKNWTSAKDASEAAQIVAKRKGRVLLTTGTRDLATFVHAMPDYAERLYVRVLPINASLDRVKELGIAASHVIAMQGPFSAALNAALIRELGIACMVTKQSGTTGGFDQKACAAKECGIELVVIERPSTQAGASLATAKRTLEERYGL